MSMTVTVTGCQFVTATSSHFISSLKKCALLIFVSISGLRNFDFKIVVNF